jgi:ABC-type bacteriocin/lantibiotic exporter with double-glycine peptidase domain
MNFITLQKHYREISLIFLVILVASIFFWPEKFTLTAIVLLILGFGMSLALIVQRIRERLILSNLMPAAMTRKVALEAIALLVIIWASGMAGRIVERWAGSTVEQSQPGFGLYAGLIAGMAFALVAGWGMRKIWVKAVRIIKRE